MNILQELKGVQTIAISGHINPDGDCVGSCMGMALYLRKNMPQAQVDVYLEPFTDALMRNIPGTETIRFDFAPAVPAYDAFIALDCGKERLGGAEAIFDNAGLTINIDHHVSNPGTGQVCYLDGNAGSACELVWDVLEEERTDARIAQALYVGMVTDTGVFRYSNTSEKTMVKAGRLLRFGFDHARIIREVFFEKTFLQHKLMGIGLGQARLYLDGLLIVSEIDYDTMQANHACKNDLEGIASEMVLTEGVDCALFLHGSGPDEYRVSLRSNTIVDVARIARMFDGGGHVRASGCTIHGDSGPALEKMIEAAREQLRKAGRL